MSWQDDARKVLSRDGVPVDGIIAFDPGAKTGFSVWVFDGVSYSLEESGFFNGFTVWDCLDVITEHTGSALGTKRKSSWSVVVEGQWFGPSPHSVNKLITARSAIETVSALCSVPSMAVSPSTWQKVLRIYGKKPRGKALKERSVEFAKIVAPDIKSHDEADAINLGRWAAGIAEIQHQRGS